MADKKKLRVIFPAYNVDAYNWERTSLVLEPLSREVELTVFTFDSHPLPEAKWCRFVRVHQPQSITNLQATAKDALNMLTELPDFDVLYCWSGGAYYQLLSVLVSQLSGKPCVMHVNGDAHLSRKHHLGIQEKLLQDAVDRLTLNNVDLIVPISTVLRSAMLERVKNPRSVSEAVPFTVDTQHFQPSEFPKQITIGYGGRISPEKGFPFYTNVMAKTNAAFRLAGPYQMNLALPENCHYDGIINLQDMPSFYARCSVLALPSFGEGIPGMILEAYACGRPVIVTPESLPPCLPVFGWKVPRDLAAWKSTIEGLTQGEIEEQGRLAREWITQKWLSWTDFAAAMKEKFLSVIN